MSFAFAWGGGVYYLTNDNALHDTRGGGWANTKGYAVGSDGVLYWLRGDGLLRRLASNVWLDVAAGVRSFALAGGGGYVFYLTGDNVLHDSRGGSWADTKSYAVDYTGSLFWLGNDGRLRRLVSNVWQDMLTGARALALSGNGWAYFLGGDNVLHESRGRILANVKDVAAAADSTLYMLGTDGKLWKQAGDGSSWDILGTNVQSIALSADGRHLSLAQGADDTTVARYGSVRGTYLVSDGTNEVGVVGDDGIVRTRDGLVRTQQTPSSTIFRPYQVVLGDSVLNGTHHDGRPGMFDFVLIQDNTPLAASVRSAADGVVVEAVYNTGGYGNMVTVLYRDGTAQRFAHLLGRSVRVGQKVYAGQVLGLQGNTGRTTGATGIHVHTEIGYAVKGPSGKYTFVRTPDWKFAYDFVMWYLNNLRHGAIYRIGTSSVPGSPIIYGYPTSPNRPPSSSSGGTTIEFDDNAPRQESLPTQDPDPEIGVA
jgi:hypothetical protein